MLNSALQVQVIFASCQKKFQKSLDLVFNNPLTLAMIVDI